MAPVAARLTTVGIGLASLFGTIGPFLIKGPSLAAAILEGVVEPIREVQDPVA